MLPLRMGEEDVNVSGNNLQLIGSFPKLLCLPRQKQEESDDEQELGKKMKAQSRSIEEESNSRSIPMLKP